MRIQVPKNFIYGLVIGYLVLFLCSFIGGLLDWLDLEIVVFLWPYPFLLFLQTWISPDLIWNWIWAWIFGLILVVLFGIYTKSRIQYFQKSRTAVFLWGLVLWIIPIAILQVLMMIILGEWLHLPIGV